MRKSPSQNDKSTAEAQSARFIEAARAAGCSEDEAVFDANMQRIVKGGSKQASHVIVSQPISDLSEITEMLTHARLPIDDLNEPGREFFSFRHGATGDVIGFGGYEAYGDEALLRSIVVASDHQGCGIGSAILDALCALAQTEGAVRAFLITTDAKGFFEPHGFQEIARENAPLSILRTRQASGICAASAPMMVKSLGS